MFNSFFNLEHATLHARVMLQIGLKKLIITKKNIGNKKIIWYCY